MWVALSSSIRRARWEEPGWDGAGRRNILVFVLAALGLSALCSIFVLHPFTADYPQSGLDPSWIAVTGEGAAARARWGVDLMFTYGPAAPLVTTYYNAEFFSRTVPLLIGFSFVHGLCAAALLTFRRRIQDPWVARTCLGLACYALALIADYQTPDSFFFCTVFIVFLLDIRRAEGDRIARVAVCLGVVVTGIFCLSKLSFALIALPLFLLADGRAVLKGALSFRLALMVVAFLATDLAYGQHLGDLPSFLRLQKEIIAGYTDAMSAAGHRGELALFVAMALGLFGVVVFVEASSRRFWVDRLILPLGLAVFLLLVFKAGFVRHDLHSVISWVAFGLVGTMLAFTCIMQRFRAAGVLSAAAAMIASLVIYPFMIAVVNHEPHRLAAMISSYGDWIASGPSAEIAAMRSAITDPVAFKASLDDTKSAAWADIRSKYPLPKLAGTVDIIPSNQTSVMANGLDFHPRPIFQEYSDYTPELIRVNRAFYEGPRAPEWVIFAPGSIDNRFPAFAEGALWPDLLRRYEPVLQLDEQIALHRRTSPLDGIVGSPTTQIARMNDDVRLGMSGPVFARIIVKPTILGRLMALVYRSPLLTMAVRTAAGGEETFRFIPVFGREGFVLSPSVVSANDFTRLAFGSRDVPPSSVVTEVKVTGDLSSRFAYAQEVTFEFSPLSISQGDHSDEAAPLFTTMVGPNPWRDFVRGAGLIDQLDGDRLSLQPPVELTFPVGGRRHLHIGFGMDRAGWDPGHADGVCFAIIPQGGTDVLWRRCLDPVNVEAERPEQSAEIDLPPGLAAVTLRASCRGQCRSDDFYVSGLVASP